MQGIPFLGNDLVRATPVPKRQASPPALPHSKDYSAWLRRPLCLVTPTRQTSLDISNTGMGIDGARAVAKALRDNRRLTSLHMARNEVTGILVVNRRVCVWR
jgi:c-di-GMP-binding flagellar brake protein YcgR